MGDSVSIETGRIQERASKLCEGCGTRLTIGAPKAQETWPQRLTLTVDQRDLLLIAAAEYEELSEQAQTISNAVEFIDWISPSVLEEERKRAYDAEIREMRKRQHEQVRNQNRRDMRRGAA
jgi:hypothetical protein